MKFKALINIQWIFLTILLCGTAYLTIGTPLEQRPFWPLALIFILNALFSTWHIKKGKFTKDFSPWPSRKVFIFVSIALAIAPAIYENDHFRYIWEGKVFAKGLSPYLLSPKEALPYIQDFESYKKVGFKSISSPYPPLALSFFSLFSLFQTSIAFALIKLFFALCMWWQRDLFTPTQKAYGLLLTPYWIHEVLMTGHIDFLGALFMAAALKKPNTSAALWSLGAAVWVKFHAVLLWPYVFFQSLHGPSKWPISGLFLLGLPLYFIVAQDSFIPSGLSIFAEKWVWNPGLLSLLHPFELSKEQSRIISALVFLAIYSIILLGAYRKKIWSNGSLPIIYAVLLFCSPVNNSWYFIWPILLCLGPFPRQAGYYGALSFLCYWPYGLPSALFPLIWPMASLLTHIPFFLLLRKIFKTQKNGRNFCATNSKLEER